MHILKLLFSVITTGFEALVFTGNKFLYASVKEVCRYVLTASINSSLLLKRCDPN
jgi:hypothetical protein